MSAPSPTDFPQLALARSRWQALRAEARALFQSLPPGEARAAGLVDNLPIFPGPGPGPGAAPGPVSPGRKTYADQAPLAARLAQRMPGVRAAALSRMAPGRHVAPGAPMPDALVCFLCLQGGGATHLVIDGARLDLADGELAMFSPVPPREAVNEGQEDRIALAFLVDPRAALAFGGVDSPEKRVVKRVMWEVFDGGRQETAGELLAPRPLAMAWPLVLQLHTSFPDLSVDLEQLVAEGPKVACSWRARGTQTAKFYNVPATGAQVTWAGVSFFEVVNGKVTAMGINWDLFGLLQQLRLALHGKPPRPR